MNTTAMETSNIDRIIAKWKDQLEAQYLCISQTTSNYERAYICSPCTAATAKEVQRNVQAARFYMWYAFENMDVIARAPHAYLPILLSDKLPAERALRSGAIGAERYGVRPVSYTHLKVRKLVTRHGGDKSQVTLHSEPCYLSLAAEEILG